jgi:hypothetical protein
MLPLGGFKSKTFFLRCFCLAETPFWAYCVFCVGILLGLCSDNYANVQAGKSLFPFQNKTVLMITSRWHIGGTPKLIYGGKTLTFCVYGYVVCMRVVDHSVSAMREFDKKLEKK